MCYQAWGFSRDFFQVLVILNEELEETYEKGSEVFHLLSSGNEVRSAEGEWTNEKAQSGHMVNNGCLLYPSWEKAWRMC